MPLLPALQPPAAGPRYVDACVVAIACAAATNNCVAAAAAVAAAKAYAAGTCAASTAACVDAAAAAACAAVADNLLLIPAPILSEKLSLLCQAQPKDPGKLQYSVYDWRIILTRHSRDSLNLKAVKDTTTGALFLWPRLLRMMSRAVGRCTS